MASAVLSFKKTIFRMIKSTVRGMKGIYESVPKFECLDGTLLPGACFQIGNLSYHHFCSADIMLFSFVMKS